MAQDSSVKAGSLWQANRIYVEDGQFENYMDWLTKTWMAQAGICRNLKGWMLEYHILSEREQARDGEPNVYPASRGLTISVGRGNGAARMHS